MTILVVDDDRDLCESLADLLTTVGHRVQQAFSGREAASLLENTPDVNLVISDYYMNDGDGRFLLEFIHSRPPPWPAFFLITGQAGITPEQAKQLGAQQFFYKPFDVEQFLGSVAACAAR